jgi:hypothetical protein
MWPSCKSANHASAAIRDPRAQVSAYFGISCASATGSSVTQFTSNPDDFSVSQSWGWRGSSLREEVCLDGDRIADPSAPSVSMVCKIQFPSALSDLDTSHASIYLCEASSSPNYPVVDKYTRVSSPKDGAPCPRSAYYLTVVTWMIW